MRAHLNNLAPYLNKPILRYLFWFIVFPWKLEQSLSDRDCSCIICGFFVRNESSNGNIGDCLYFDGADYCGKPLRIPEGGEKETARQCTQFFRMPPGMTTEGFIAWRLGMETVANQNRIERQMKLVALLALVVAIIQLLQDI